MSERDRRRQILELVASGELPPDEAAQLLAALPPDDAGPEAQAEATEVTEIRVEHDAPVGPAPTDPDGVVTIRIRSNCRVVSIVGDPDVRTAVAEGDHIARIEEGVLTIESTLEQSPGFAFMRTPGMRARGMVRVGAGHVRPLNVRMNPDLALDSQMDAGSMTIRDVRGPIRAHTSAGALRIQGFASPIDLRVAAGSATAQGRIDHGMSRVECDAGKVSIRLTADSSVDIKGRVNLGQLNTPDRIGDGAGELQIVANLGAVDVGLDTDDDPDDEAE
jgi:hypothetical protein